jgi:hypothetical protein
MDGPFKGLIHEIKPGWRMPDRIGQKDMVSPNLVHWYRVEGDKGYLDSSENDEE